MLDDRETRMLESLLQQYGDLQIKWAKDLTRVEGKADSNRENRQRLDKELDESRKEMKDALDKLSDKMDKCFSAVNKKIDAQTAATKWTPAQWALIIVGVVSAFGTVLVALISKAPT